MIDAQLPIGTTQATRMRSGSSARAELPRARPRSRTATAATSVFRNPTVSSLALLRPSTHFTAVRGAPQETARGAARSPGSADRRQAARKSPGNAKKRGVRGPARAVGDHVAQRALPDASVEPQWLRLASGPPPAPASGGTPSVRRGLRGTRGACGMRQAGPVDAQAKPLQAAIASRVTRTPEPNVR